MSAVGQYILTITSAAAIVSIICTIFDSKSHSASYIKLISGLFLTITILSPLLDLRFDTLSGYLSSINVDAENAVRDGAYTIYEQKRSVIKEQTEAYILERAEGLGTAITVEIEFSGEENITPKGIQIHGTISPYAKQQLSGIIAKELGIPEESQKWY